MPSAPQEWLDDCEWITEYRLETFSEPRLSERVFEPFTRLSQMPWSRLVQVQGVPWDRSDKVCNVQGIPTQAKAAEKMRTLLRYRSQKVYPIIDFPGPEISLASQRAIAEHNAVLAVSSHILWQHQPIELIPITEVHYQYSGKPYVYYIYGLKSKVYALDYPERCCCSCTII